VDGNTPCDFVLRIDRHYAALFPAGGRSHLMLDKERSADVDVPGSLRGGWGPIDLQKPADASEMLEDYLRKIARARNLLRLAEIQRKNADSEISVALELRSVELTGLDQVTGEYEEKKVGTELRPNEHGTVMANLGESYAIRVHNNARERVHVTLLYVDPDMEIAALLPQQTRFGDYVVDEQRIESDAYRDSVFITAEPAGPQYVVALATPEPNNFFLLEQSALNRVKGSGRWNSGSSLDDLLLQSTCFPGMKGPQQPRQRRLFDDSWSTAVLSFELKP